MERAVLRGTERRVQLDAAAAERKERADGREQCGAVGRVEGAVAGERDVRREPCVDLRKQRAL